MIALTIAILEFISGLIPALANRFRRKPDGSDAWKSQLTYWQGRPRSIGSQFFGRQAELRAIADAFKDRQVVVLSGGPGVGESQLPSEYVQKSKRKGFWTPGGETPEQTLNALAPQLGIDQEDLTAQNVVYQTCRRLQALPSKTLWVIDNLADLDQLNSFLNDTGNLSPLITTRMADSILRQTARIFERSEC